MSTTTSETQLISCPSCGAENRVRPVDHHDLEAVCGRCKTPLTAVGPVTVTDANFHEEVEQSRLPVLLDLWAPWCPPCRMLAPVIEQLAAELSGRVKVGKLNTDENKRTAVRFSIRSIPTLLVLKDGVEIERLVGAHPKEEILRRLEPLIG